MRRQEKEIGYTIKPEDLRLPESVLSTLDFPRQFFFRTPSTRKREFLRCFLSPGNYCMEEECLGYSEEELEKLRKLYSNAEYEQLESKVKIRLIEHFGFREEEAEDLLAVHYQNAPHFTLTILGESLGDKKAYLLQNTLFFQNKLYRGEDGCIYLKCTFNHLEVRDRGSKEREPSNFVCRINGKIESFFRLTRKEQNIDEQINTIAGYELVEIRTPSSLLKRIFNGEVISLEALYFRNYLNQLTEEQKELKAQAKLLLNTVEEKMRAVKSGACTSISRKGLNQILTVARIYLQDPSNQEYAYAYQAQIKKLEKNSQLAVLAKILAVLLGIAGLAIGSALVLGGSGICLTGVVPAGATAIAFGSVLSAGSLLTLLRAGYLLFKREQTSSGHKDIHNALIKLRQPK
jgi:hypothetical protein